MNIVVLVNGFFELIERVGIVYWCIIWCVGEFVYVDFWIE